MENGNNNNTATYNRRRQRIRRERLLYRDIVLRLEFWYIKLKNWDLFSTRRIQGKKDAIKLEVNTHLALMGKGWVN